LVENVAKVAALAFNAGDLYVVGSVTLAGIGEAANWPVLPPLSAWGTIAVPVVTKASRKASSNAKRILSKNTIALAAMIRR
jgi:hypothetical protein